MGCSDTTLVAEIKVSLVIFVIKLTPRIGICNHNTLKLGTDLSA